MQRVLDETDVALLSLSRPLLREPDWPDRLRRGLSDASRCISCNRCYSASGIDRDAFLAHFNGGTAMAALSRDERFVRAARRHGLPAAVVEYGGDVLLVPGVPTWERAVAAIARLSDGALRPEPPEATPAALAALLARRPALHAEEIRAAFGVGSPAALRELVRPLVLDGIALVREASRGWFLERRAGLAAGVGVC